MYYRKIVAVILLLCAWAARAADHEVIVDGMRGPENLAFDNGDFLYVSDTDHLWRVTKDGNKEELYARDPGKDGISLGGVSLGPGGKIYFSVGNAIKIFDPANGSISVLVEGFEFSNGNCFDDAGNFFIADSNSRKIHVVPAGTGEARLLKEKLGSAGVGVNGLVWDRKDSTLYFTANLPSRLGGLRLGPDLNVKEEITVTKFPFGGLDDLTMDNEGNFYVCLWLNGKIMKVSPSGKKELFLDKLDGPSALAFGPGADSDELYICIKGGNTKFEGTKLIVVGAGAKGYRLPFLP
jgi:sugar lactone lactonase YvrE